MRVLGIESSCDETGVAVYCSEKGLLGHLLHSQIALHRPYGGVVPELASRDHLRVALHLIEELLDALHLFQQDIDGIAYTAGPGLMGALLTGACLLRSLAYAWQIPAIGVHHLEAHLLAPMLEENPPAFPFVALLVSGGHTMLVLVEGIGHYRVLGESLDDAVGEAFDKTAKLLGLPYPGGPALAKLATQGDPKRFHLPRPLLNKPTLDFSFSGLKTAALYLIQAQNSDLQTKADIARAFEEAAIACMVQKSIKALRLTKQQRLVVAGGVGANTRLRDTLAEEALAKNFQVFYPRPIFCTDNGAMIAYAGCQRLLAGQSSTLNIQTFPRWPLSQLSPA